VTHVLVLQLSETDPPERLGDWLREAGAGVDVRLAVDGVPEGLDGLDALVCLGGGMGAQDDTQHPWLADVRRLLADAVTSRSQRSECAWARSCSRWPPGDGSGVGRPDPRWARC